MGEEFFRPLRPVAAHSFIEVEVEVEAAALRVRRPRITRRVADRAGHHIHIEVNPLLFQAVDIVVEPVEHFGVELQRFFGIAHEHIVEVVQPGHIVAVYFQLAHIFAGFLRGGTLVEDGAVPFSGGQETDRRLRGAFAGEQAVGVDDDPVLRSVLLRQEGAVERRSRHESRPGRAGKLLPAAVDTGHDAFGGRGSVAVFGDRRRRNDPDRGTFCTAKTQFFDAFQLRFKLEMRYVQSHTAAGVVRPEHSRESVGQRLGVPPVADIAAGLNLESLAFAGVAGHLHAPDGAGDVVAEGVQQIKMVADGSGGGGDFRFFQSGGKIRRTHGKDGAAVVLRGIDDRKRHVGESGRGAPFEIARVVVRPLIGPAAFAVSGDRVREAHIGGAAQVEQCGGRLDFQVAEFKLPIGILKTKCKLGVGHIGGNIGGKSERFPVEVPELDLGTGP